jgi:hypothetical protein
MFKNFGLHFYFLMQQQIGFATLELNGYRKLSLGILPQSCNLAYR